MNTRQQIVHRYMDGFRRSDHDVILACLTDDVVWRIHGLRTTAGKAEFDDEIENPAFEGSPELTVERTIDAGDTVVVTGTGVGHKRDTGRFRFAYSDLFTFRNGLIAQVDSYVVPLSRPNLVSPPIRVSRTTSTSRRAAPGSCERAMNSAAP
jgi:ketosteroid isomerase-like protein